MQALPVQADARPRHNPVAEALLAHRGFGNAAMAEADAAMLNAPGGLPPLYAGPVTPAPSGGQLLRTSVMVAIFIVGAMIGLATTWWFMPASAVPLAASAAPKAQAKSAPSSQTAGVGLNERPYDEPPPLMSKAAPQAEDEREGALAALISPEPREASVVPDSATPAAAASRPGVAPEASRPAAPTGSKPTAGHPNAKRQGSPGRSEEHSPPPRPALAQNDPPAKRAYAQRPSSTGPARGAHASGSSRQPALARCEKKSNFILKEHCRWEVCNGSWGKNGCPSYERQASIY